jgi:hypothetical protein
MPGDLITHVNGTSISPLLTSHPTLDPIYPLFSNSLKVTLSLTRGRRWIIPKIRHLNPLFNTEFYDIDSDSEVVSTSLSLSGNTALDDVLEPQGEFRAWLKSRKTKWRQSRGKTDEHYAALYPERRQHKKREGNEQGGSKKNKIGDEEEGYYTMKGKDEFWKDLGFDTVEDWQQGRVEGWRRKYRWNRVRLDVIKEKLGNGQGVGLPMEEEGGKGTFREVQEWLAVRKVEWRVKRAREKEYNRELVEDVKRAKMGVIGLPQEKNTTTTEPPDSVAREVTSSSSSSSSTSSSTTLPTLSVCEKASSLDPLHQTVLEHLTLSLTQPKPPAKTYSIDWLFDLDICGNDDLVFLTLSFLTEFEVNRLVTSVSKHKTRQMAERQNLWSQKCKMNTRWNLPRNPRKAWFELYVTNLKKFFLERLKKSEELLSLCMYHLRKGDHLTQIKKKVLPCVRDFNFSVDFTSGSVGDRNGLLNWAVVYRRPKVAKWLVNDMGADLETKDSGFFTPLCNAAWNGDLQMVRFLLWRGARRDAIGLTHCSKGFGAVQMGFKGLTAEGWARIKGWKEVEMEIKYGVAKEYG